MSILKATITYLSHKNEIEKGIGSFIDRAVQKSLAIMERNIKVNTPVKEGTLRRSIQHRSTGFGKGEVHTASVQDGKETNYAVYVEYGTRYMAPRAMFRKGVAQSEEQIKKAFADEAKKSGMLYNKNI